MRLQHREDHLGCQLVDGRHTPKNALISERFPEWPPTRGEARRDIADSGFIRRLDALEASLARLETAIPRDLAGWMNDCVSGYMKLLDRVQALESSLRVLAAGRGR